MLLLPASMCVILVVTSPDSHTHDSSATDHTHHPGSTAYCPTEPAEWIGRGGGMNGHGWDGEGTNSATIYFHIENTTNDMSAQEQRSAYIFALVTWASYVDIDFVEIAAPNWDQSIDFRYAVGDHCAIEGDECGDPDCPFDGAGGVLAHAGFPPGAPSQCVDPMSETWAGNVHFDDDDMFEQDDAGAGFSLMLIAAHEIGHALGLVHDTGSGGPHIMRPTINTDDGMQAPSSSDIANLRSGYAAGVGSVTKLEDSGIWVNSAWLGPENGTAGNPFDTVAEGVGGLPPGNDGITIHVLGGYYPESLTISTPCTITSEFSTAYIGQ